MTRDEAARAFAENARLREALRPFAKIAPFWPEHVLDSCLVTHATVEPGSSDLAWMTVGYFRAAARALAEGQP